MKRLLILGAMVVLILLLGRNITTNATYKEIILGYCPTMQENAEEISVANNNVVLVKQASTSDALMSLKKGSVDAVLIGRLAKQSEIENVNELALKNGYTLITNEKRFIQKSELQKIRIHTSLNKNIAEQILPDIDVVYYQSTEEAVSKGLIEAVLIDWRDFKDNYELLVIMDGNNKVKEFRIPVLYFFDKKLLDNLNL